MRFTRDSLNSGFLAMAEKLDLCDISKVVDKMGVQTYDRTRPRRCTIAMTLRSEVIGSDNVVAARHGLGATRRSPTTASAASPKAIDKVIDPDGREIRAAEDLHAGARSRDRRHRRLRAAGRDGVAAAPEARETRTTAHRSSARPVPTRPGRRGSSSRAPRSRRQCGSATPRAKSPLSKQWANGTPLNNLRYPINKQIMRTVDEVYGGDKFPSRTGTCCVRC